MENLPIFKDINKEKMFIINQYNYGDNRFIITIDTTKGTGSTFTLPTRSGYSYNCTVDWGDNSTSEITAYNDADITHNYASGGVYQIKISGTFQSWYFNNGGDKLKLISIDNWGNVGFITMTSAFYGCTNLTTIPNSAIGNPSINAFTNTFFGCTGLSGSIPADLFRYNVNVSTYGFTNTFFGCTGLSGSIPADLFRYNVNVSTYGFQQTFFGCTGLSGSIPADLFRYNVNVSTYGFSRTFYGCTGLSGSIPADLFRYNVNVSKNGFQQTFCNCNKLTDSIPADLFRYNVNVSENGFQQTFLGCTGLSGSIPEDLFYYNSLCTNYEGTFYNCRNLVLPTRLFNLSNLVIVTIFDNFMRAASTTYSNTGTIQDIWNYATGATSTNAFFNQTSLSNYSSIPNGWKGL